MPVDVLQPACIVAWTDCYLFNTKTLSQHLSELLHDNIDIDLCSDIAIKKCTRSGLYYCLVDLLSLFLIYS